MLYQPLQVVLLPSHFPFDKQVRTVDPIQSNPSSQLNVLLLGNTVLIPNIEPLMGTAREPQSTAVNKKIKHKS
jgi:hypothetical protein